MKKVLLTTIIVMLGFSGVWAQVTTSSLNGTITDGTSTVPGATVLATHVPTGTRYGTISNAEGKFNIANVRVGGPYSVEISFVGYQTTKYENLTLKLGEPLSLNVKMSESATELNEVIVSADGFAGEVTGASTGISNKEINSLPTINRSISDFTRLTPQSNGNSFGGRDGRYNNLQIDGANFNNAFGLSSNPLPGGRSQPISLDAIEEIQVNISPFDVRQAGFTGAGINAITRSGTNDYTGSVYGFTRNQKMNGRKIGDFEIDELDESSSQTLGFRVGGPIIKDKLFFFINGERNKDTGAGAGATNLWKASTNGIADPANNIARTTVADLQAVKNHLINTWGYDPGAYEGYANEAEAISTNFLARLDWNISDKHSLAVRYNQVIGSSGSLASGTSGPRPRSSNSFSRVSQNSMLFEKGTYATENSVRSFSLELNSRFNDKLSNQFLATYSKIQDTRTSPSEEFPFVDIGDGLAVGESYQNYMSFGYELFSYNNDLINDNYSFINNLTYLTGNHTITAGASFDVQKFANNFVRLGTSYYRYATVADFLTTGTPGEVAPIMFGLTYPYAGQDPYARTNFGNIGVYGQDKWAVNSKLDLTIGIRAELPIYMNDLTANPSIDALTLLDTDGNDKNYSSGEWPKTRLMVSPRIGFRYDVNGDKSFILRGGTGIFTGRVPFVWLSNMPTGSGVLQNNVEPGSYASVAGWIGDISFQPDKYYWLDNTPASASSVFIQSPNAGVPGGFALVDNDFRMPSVWRTSIGGDFKIPGTPLIATADIIYTKDINGVFQFGANRKDATQSISGAGGDTRDFWASSGDATYNPALGANQGVVLANTKEKGNSFSSTIGVTMPSTKGLFGSLFYTYSSSNEISGNPGSSASSAWGGSPIINSPNDQILMPSAYAVPNRIVASVSYRIDYAKHFGTTFSLFYDGSNQGRYSYIYANSIQGPGGFANSLIFIPEDLDDLNFVDNGSFTIAEQKAALESFIENDKFLSKNRGDYADRNGALLPWLNRFDFRLLQDIYTNIGKRKNTIQFSMDILNVGNLLNSKWGVQQQLNGAENLMRVASVSPTGVPTFQMNTIQEGGQTVLPTTAFRDITSTSTTWAMQLGLRYIF